MIPASEYYNHSENLQSNINALSNPDLDVDKDREKINLLVLNFVINYLLEYLKIFWNDIYDIRNQINMLLRNKYSSYCGNDINMYPTDIYPLQNITSTHSTAAIVKEIIFNNKYKNTWNFLSLDLWSWTWILSASSLIWAQRRQIKNIWSIAIEQSQEAVLNSRQLLNKFFPWMCEVRNQDLTLERSYKWLNSLDINSIISETISRLTPKLYLNWNGKIITENPKRSSSTKKQSNADPFVQIMQLLFNNIDNLWNKIEEWEIAFFPNFITWLYEPDYEESRLSLKTYTKESFKLEDIWNEFSHFEKLIFYSDQRWETLVDKITEIKWLVKDLMMQWVSPQEIIAILWKKWWSKFITIQTWNSIVKEEQ